MRLHTIKPNPKSKKKKKRVGRGESSGLGKTCGRGSNGQKSRSGGSIRDEFEGGQMPLLRRLPKKGFSNARFKKNVSIINLCDIDRYFEDGEIVNLETLYEKKLIKKSAKSVKLLSKGKLEKKVILDIQKYSNSAKKILLDKGIEIK